MSALVEAIATSTADVCIPIARTLVVRLRADCFT